MIYLDYLYVYSLNSLYNLDINKPHKMLSSKQVNYAKRLRPTNNKKVNKIKIIRDFNAN